VEVFHDANRAGVALGGLADGVPFQLAGDRCDDEQPGVIYIASDESDYEEGQQEHRIVMSTSGVLYRYSQKTKVIPRPDYVLAHRSRLKEGGAE
jgi:hypothetical protein